MAVCVYHQDRPGVGVCMRCRAVICAACCTRLDGINHCHACLRALGQRTPARAAGSGIVGAVLVVGIAGLFLFGLLVLAPGWLAP